MREAHRVQTDASLCEWLLSSGHCLGSLASPEPTAEPSVAGGSGQLYPRHHIIQPDFTAPLVYLANLPDLPWERLAEKRPTSPGCSWATNKMDRVLLSEGERYKEGGS